MPPQDPQQDQDFAKASPTDQHAYLMATDADYAKATKPEQAAYLQHIAPPGPNAGLAPPAGGPASQPMRNEGPVARNVTSFRTQLANAPAAMLHTMTKPFTPSGIREMDQEKAEEDAAMAQPGIAPALKYTGEMLNRKLNPVVKTDTGVDYGATAANLLPYAIPVAKGLRSLDAGTMGRAARAGMAGAKEAAWHTPIVGPMARAAMRGASESWNGPEATAPRPMTPPPLQWNTRTQEPIPQVAPPPVRYSTPAEPPPQASPPPIRYSTNAAPEAPNKMTPPPPLRWGKTPGRVGPGGNPNTPVTFVPEPRGLFTGEEPNYMASVPRGKLGKMAMSRKPGAGTQMQQLGQPIIYIPGEADVPPPRR